MAKYAMRIIETLSRTVIVDADDLTRRQIRPEVPMIQMKSSLKLMTLRSVKLFRPAGLKMELFQMEEIQSFSHTFLVKQILAFTIFTGMHLITK